MITCTECGARHYPGVLFCDACGAAVHPAARAYLDAFAPRERRAAPPANKIARMTREPQPAAGAPLPRLVEKPKARPLRVIIPEQEVELALQAELIQVGRADPDTESAPGLDLTPYQGLEKGVSRRHATIQWVEDGYVILDQHSINGTWLDGIRLVPGYAYQIPPGAEVRFGELLVQMSLAD